MDLRVSSGVAAGSSGAATGPTATAQHGVATLAAARAGEGPQPGAAHLRAAQRHYDRHTLPKKWRLFSRSEGDWTASAEPVLGGHVGAEAAPAGIEAGPDPRVGLRA